MNKFIYLFMVVLFSNLSFAAGDNTVNEGEKIAIEANLRNTGWGDSQTEMHMTLIDKRGKKAIREIRSKALEVEGDGDKGLTIFDVPKDVQGTAFLSYSHALKADEQWIYLPALKRVKRISSSNKSGPFMGSEFAYEDISSFELEKYSYKYLGDETIEGKDYFMLEMVPLYKHSGYTKQIVWVDKQEYFFKKIDYYDRKKTLLKSLVFSDHKKYKDKFWRAQTMTMVNHQRGKSTILEFSEFRFGEGLTDKDFNRSNLKRSR